MGRPYAACLGCIALTIQIILGLLFDDSPDSILIRALYSLVGFALMGWAVGQVADNIVRDSVEANYRRRIEKLRQDKEAKEKAAA